MKNAIKVLQDHINNIPEESAMLNWDVEELKDELYRAILVLQMQQHINNLINQNKRPNIDKIIDNLS